jgi:hypothetical protein
MTAPGHAGHPHDDHGQARDGRVLAPPGYGQPQAGLASAGPGHPAAIAPGGHAPVHAAAYPAAPGYPQGPASYAGDPRSASAYHARTGGFVLEPWSERVRTLMLVFGVLLIACFIAPWGVGAGQTRFAWSVLSDPRAPLVAKLLPIVLAASGALAVLLGSLPMQPAGRAVAAMLIGATPLVTVDLVVPVELSWPPVAELVGTIALVAGLLLRARHPAELGPRIVIAIGAGLVLLPELVPSGAGVPLIDSLEALEGTKIDPTLLISPLHVVLTLLCLLAWLPGPGSAGALPLAWAQLGFVFVPAILPLLGHDGALAAVKARLDGVIYVPLALMAWTAFVGYGGAMLFGRRLERA